MSTLQKSLRRRLFAEALEARLVPSGTKPMAVIMAGAGGGGGGVGGGGPISSVVVTTTSTQTVTVTNTSTDTYGPDGSLIGQSFGNQMARTNSNETVINGMGTDANGNALSQSTYNLSQKTDVSGSNWNWSVDPSTGVFQSGSDSFTSSDNFHDAKIDQLVTDQSGNSLDYNNESVNDKFSFSVNSTSFTDDGQQLLFSGTSDSGTSSYSSFKEATTFADPNGNVVVFTDGAEVRHGSSAHSDYQDVFNYLDGSEADSGYSNNDRNSSSSAFSGIAFTSGATGVTESNLGSWGSSNDVLGENYSNFHADSSGYSWGSDNLVTRTDVGFNTSVQDVADPNQGTVTETGRSHTTTDTDVRESGSNSSYDAGTGISTSGTTSGHSQTHEVIDQFWSYEFPFSYQNPYAQQLV